MLVAAIDSATLVLSCALVDVAFGEEARERRSRTERAPLKPAPGETGGHGRRLPGVLEELLLAEGLELEAVEGFAVGLGPGSFTGLRIGLATFKGLAYARHCPIAGVSSLAAMAFAASRHAPEGATLVPLLDARKSEVYAGFYRAGQGDALLLPVGNEVALSPGDLVERLKALPRPIVFGEGREAYPETFAAFEPPPFDEKTPRALEIAALSTAGLCGLKFSPAALFALEPHYVRASEAETKFPKGLGPGADP